MKPTALFLEVLDGLMLGAGFFEEAPLRIRLIQPPQYLAWVRAVADVLSRAGLEVRVGPLGRRVELVAACPGLEKERDRWYAQQHLVPRDVRLTPTALAHWFAGAGARASNGYSVRLHTRGGLADAEFLVEHLRSTYHWEPELFFDRRSPMIRLSRSGDRLGLRRLVVGLLPGCFAGRLNLKESAPCSAAEAARRRRPRRLDQAKAAEARRRVAAGEPYADIARDLGVGERAIGKLARGETHADPGVSIIRRRASPRRLTPLEEREVLERLKKGESQHAVARAMGLGQPRVSRLARTHRL